jgi:hypothetical protein
MIGWKTDIVVSLGIGNRTAEVSTIRSDGVIIVKSNQKEMFYDLGTGLLHRTDPYGELDNHGITKAQPVEVEDWAPPVLEQLVSAFANPQVKADHLYQGLKASSVTLPPRIKLVRNYLGGVMVYQDAEQLSVGQLIDFIMEGFDKE